MGETLAVLIAGFQTSEAAESNFEALVEAVRTRAVRPGDAKVLHEHSVAQGVGAGAAG